MSTANYLRAGFLLALGFCFTACGPSNTSTARLVVDRKGEGRITSPDFAGLDCGSLCSVNVPRGATLQLKAEAIAPAVFTGWSGGGCSGTGTCEVTLDSDQVVTATFEVPQVIFTVTRIGVGNPPDVRSPDGVIHCGDQCSYQLPVGTRISLPVPTRADVEFKGWEGACNGDSPCEFTLVKDSQLTATFSQLYSLTTSVAGSVSSGRILSNPTGIDCGSQCSVWVRGGQQWELRTEVVNPMHLFTGWEGDCTGSDSICKLQFPGNHAVTARFKSLNTWAKTWDAQPFVYSIDGKSGDIAVGTTVQSPGSIDLGGGTILPVSFTGGNRTPVIAKFDAQGNHKWSVRIEGVTDAYPLGTAVEPDGSVLVSGGFVDTIGEGNLSAVSNGGTDAFVARFTPTGTLTGLLTWGGGSDNSAEGIAVSGTDEIYVTGYFTSTFLGKLSPTLQFEWQHPIPADLPEASKTSGVFVHILQRNSQPGDPAGCGVTLDPYQEGVASFDKDGNCRWLFPFPSGTRVNGIAATQDGGVLASGQFQGVLDYGSGTLGPTGSYGPFGYVLRFDAAGNVLWGSAYAHTGTGAAQVNVVRAVELESGEIAVAGDFKGFVDFGSGTWQSGQVRASFISKLSSTGARLYSREELDPGGTSFSNLVAAPGSKVVIGGPLYGTTNFGAVTITPTTGGVGRAFLAGYDP